LLEKYEIVPQDERSLFDKKTTDVVDFAKRRELKINQYKKEKDLKLRIEVSLLIVTMSTCMADSYQTIRRRTGQVPSSDDASTDYDLIASLLPPASPKALSEDEDLESDTDEILRETTLILLRLLYAHASAQLQSMEQELELLRNAPPTPLFGPSEGDERDKKRNAEVDEWKLDIPVPGGPDGKGPLLDPTGKVKYFFLFAQSRYIF